VPTDNAGIGDVARNSEPFMRQVFVTGDQDEETLKRQVTGNVINMRYMLPTVVVLDGSVHFSF
jgi:glutamate synthase domain-containing protein 1